MDVTIPLAIRSVFIGWPTRSRFSGGLFRHYWVLVKLWLTLLATKILLMEVQKVGYGLSLPQRTLIRGSFQGSLLHSDVGLLVLLIIAFLSVYKPKGLTRLDGVVNCPGTELPRHALTIDSEPRGTGFIGRRRHGLQATRA